MYLTACGQPSETEQGTAPHTLGTLSRRPLPMRWVTKRNVHTAGAMPWKDGAHLCRNGRSGATRRAALALVSLSHCALRKAFRVCAIRK